MMTVMTGVTVRGLKGSEDEISEFFFLLFFVHILLRQLKCMIEFVVYFYFISPSYLLLICFLSLFKVFISHMQPTDRPTD